MSNRLILAPLLAALLAPALATSAEKPNPQQEGAALLARAAEVSNIRSADAKPFRIRAGVSLFAVEAGNLEGSYSLVWSSPNRWREETTFPGFTQVRVAGDRKFWQARNVDHLPERIWEFQNLIDLMFRLRLQPKERIRKVYDSRKGGPALRCLELKAESGIERELCFDATLNTLVREKRARSEYAYDDYLGLGGRFFSKSMRFVRDGRALVELRIEELVEIPGVDDSTFTPPAGAQEWETCAEPEKPRVEKQVAPVYPDAARRSQITGEVVVYALIGTDGRLHNLKVLASTWPGFATPTLEAWQQARYKPQTCNGKPVPSETIIRTTFRMY